MELESLLKIICAGTSNLPRHSHEVYNVALYLIKWLEPIKYTGLNKPRTLSNLEGNNVTQAIAYWANIPESIIVDVLKEEKQDD